MAKGERSAYVALPMESGDIVEPRQEEVSEGGACATISKILALAALASLVVVGAARMSCGEKIHQQTNQLRSHEQDRPKGGPTYWDRLHHYSSWGHGHHHHHGDALPGPHHVHHGNNMMGGHGGNMMGRDHGEDELPAILRHPMHNKPGKNQAVVRVHHHPNPGDLPELKNPTNENKLPKELRHVRHNNGKQNTVVVKTAEPEDFPTEEKTNEEEVEMPEILRHPPPSYGNGKQGTYVVHSTKNRHEKDQPVPREAWPSSDEEEEEVDMTEEEEYDAKLDEELAQLEHDFQEDFFGEDEEEEEEYDDDESEDEDEEFDMVEWEAYENESESLDEDAYDSEDEDDWEDEDDDDAWEDEDEDEDDWEDEPNDFDEEIVEAVEELPDMIVVEERIEEP